MTVPTRERDKTKQDTVGGGASGDDRRWYGTSSPGSDNTRSARGGSQSINSTATYGGIRVNKIPATADDVRQNTN